MKYDAVIWDVDGTLLDTREGLVAAYRHAFSILALPPKTDEEIASYIGPTPQTIFTEKFGMDTEAAQRGADIFRERYKAHDLLKAVAYEGILDVLRRVQELGLPQAVATNKRQDYATDICLHFGIDHYCSPIYGADNNNKLTKADLIHKCVAALGASNAVMIGDTEGDKSAAENAGVAFIGVNFGFGFNGIDGYANTPADIIPLLTEGQNTAL